MNAFAVGDEVVVDHPALDKRHTEAGQRSLDAEVRVRKAELGLANDPPVGIVRCSPER